MGDSPLISRELTCPVCSQRFTLHTPRSTAPVLSRRDTDFCPYYSSINPLFYAVWVCPGCGYAALKDHFRTLSDSQRVTMRMSLETVTDHRKHDFRKPERNLFAGMISLQLAARCYAWRGVPQEVLAGLQLRLAWLCRYGNDRRREQQYLALAAEHYEAALEVGLARDASVTSAHVSYLVGEIHRRLGHGPLAVDWLLRAIQGDPDRGETWTRARDQLYETKASIRFFEYLQGVEILQPLAIEELAFLAAQIRSRTVPAGRTLFKEGDPAESMFILMSGSMEVKVGARPVAELSPPAVLGEMSLLTGQPRSATAIALQHSELLEIDRVAFKTTLRANPAIATEIARIVEARKQVNAHIDELPTPASEPTIGIVGRLRSFFEVS